ncbi:aspartyl protease family protein [Alteromonas sp. A079]|uniref:aspartyl protease family protein n=1 Tax=Alteromonas sp. A079 TaxID=3410268 RepID=UPI003BA3520B
MSIRKKMLIPRFIKNKSLKESVRAILKLTLLLTILSAMSGCRIWDLANFQWQNAKANVSWGKGQSDTVVPFTILNNHIIVSTTVNGVNGFRFVLDSGAAATVVTETAATQLLNFPQNKPIAISGSGSGDDPIAYIVDNTQIGVGDFSISKLSVIYAPTSAMPFDSIAETYFDGVLGADFFNCCLIEINYDKKTLQISLPTQTNRQGYASQSWQVLDIEVEDNTPYLSTQIRNGETDKTVKVMLDTGSTGTLSLFANKQAFAIPNNAYTARTTGISGDTMNKVGLLRSLVIGKQHFSSLPTYFRVTGSNSQSGSHGVLGNQIMQRFNMTFDFSEEKVWIQANHKTSVPILLDRSGLRLLPHNEGAIVKDIAVGTGADALNISMDSILKSIDGIDINRDNFDRALSVLSDPEVSSVHICWIAKENQTCGKLALYSRIKM